MARVTRSKKIDVVEDKILPGTDPSTKSCNTEHTALVEITNPAANDMASIMDPMTSELNGLKAAYRVAIGAPPSKRGGTKGKNHKESRVDSRIEEVRGQLNDGRDGICIPAPTPAPKTIHQSPSSRQEQGTKGEVTVKPERTGRTTRRQAAQAQAAEAALLKPTGGLKDGGEQLSPKSEDREIPDVPNDFVLEAAHQTCGIPTINLPEPLDTSPESPAGSSGLSPTRSPTRSVKTLDDIEQEYGENKRSSLADGDEDGDSFIEQITARSPAKRVSRIEDSLEALDQLEEALEAMDQATLRKGRVNSSPGKDSLQSKSKAGSDKINSGKNFATKPPLVKSGYGTTRVKPIVPKAPVMKRATSMTLKTAGRSTSQKPPPVPKLAAECETAKRNPPFKRPISLQPPKELCRSARTVTKPAFTGLPGEAVALKLKQQREARIAKRQSSECSFQAAESTKIVAISRVRSAKPPTKPEFELPGEALSRRKKEAHEARIKAQEEEERKRREFKAKPLPKNAVPGVAPRNTITSRARQSRIGLDSILSNGEGKSTKVESNIGARRPSIAELTAANTSARRAPGTPSQQSFQEPSTTRPHISVVSSRNLQRTVSATEAHVQRQRAKEIYNRDQKLTADIERERREREAAAKQARAEAAERGRQASREWAEKQLVKRLADGGKSTIAACGMGGQLQLKAC